MNIKTTVTLGIIAAFALFFIVAGASVHAQSPTDTSTLGVTSTTLPTATSAPVTTPGIPNTGVGGNATTNFALLALSAIVMVGGVASLASYRRQS